MMKKLLSLFRIGPLLKEEVMEQAFGGFLGE